MFDINERKYLFKIKTVYSSRQDQTNKRGISCKAIYDLTVVRGKKINCKGKEG